MFSKIARLCSYIFGHSITFSFAALVVLTWLILGPYYRFSDSWELFINTLTTIITFLMVFLIQNTQNHDTVAIQLKLDEIIRSIEGGRNELVKIEQCTDEELEEILKRYENLAANVKIKIQKGEKSDDRPSINTRTV